MQCIALRSFVTAVVGLLAVGCALPPPSQTPSPIDGIVGPPAILVVSEAPLKPPTDTTGPGFNETTQFLTSFLAATVSRYGPSMDRQLVRSGIQQTLSSKLGMARFDQCAMTVSGDFPGYRDVALNLGHLDPNAVRDGPDAEGAPTLRLETTGRVRTILAYKLGVLRRSPADTARARPLEGWNTLVLVLRDRDKEGGDRLKRALTHAMKLCGARATPF